MHSHGQDMDCFAALAMTVSTALCNDYFFAYDTPMPARTSACIPYGAIG
jgi:hypothetical protein